MISRFFAVSTALIVFISAPASAKARSKPRPAATIFGDWQCRIKCGCHPRVANPRILQSGKKVVFLDECNNATDAIFTDKKTVVLPGYNMTGVFSDDRKSMFLNQVTIWTG